jgi:hypothetical protein
MRYLRLIDETALHTRSEQRLMILSLLTHPRCGPSNRQDGFHIRSHFGIGNDDNSSQRSKDATNQLALCLQLRNTTLIRIDAGIASTISIDALELLQWTHQRTGLDVGETESSMKEEAEM